MLDFLETLVREAGEILLRHHGALERIEKKGARDLVTVADRESEAHVIARLRAAFPEHRILAEETASTEAIAGRQWIIDPLDGTTNFVYGIPHFAVSIGYYEDGLPVAAAVFNPLLSECYLAAAGKGATKNGRPLQVRREARLEEAVLCTGFSYRLEEKADSNLGHWSDFATRTRGLRRLGSAALDLCYVAEGRYDGFWELHLSPWDVAAGALVAREAGAVVSDRRGGGDWLVGGSVVAANAALHREILGVLGA